ncbi:MAG: general secretion pathway protein GspK [Verrucomicrobiae bacterium]|nr:general secretion pathway protein GspK [Verrucomicrobiae bacterium]
MKLLKQNSSQRGIALLLVIWAIVTMSVAILGVVEFVKLDLNEGSVRSKDFRARQLAESGLAFAMHPQIRRNDPLLRQKVGFLERFEVQVSTEESKLNINRLLKEKNDSGILQRLFENWGLSDKESVAVIDCLKDWVDKDDLRQINGAEKDYYEELGYDSYPPNRSFLSISEMELVKGMDLVAKAKPDWASYFTIWGAGKLDVNEASEELLRIVCEVSATQANTLIKFRSGADRKLNTLDDVEIKDGKQACIIMGVPEILRKTVADRLTARGSTKRIMSKGYVGDYLRSIEVVWRTSDGPRQFLEWQEY